MIYVVDVEIGHFVCDFFQYDEIAVLYGRDQLPKLIWKDNILMHICIWVFEKNFFAYNSNDNFAGALSEYE